MGIRFRSCSVALRPLYHLDGGKKGLEIDYSVLRARWEHAVVSNPLVAFRAGPPSWLVLEDYKEGKESFHDANERVKARYFNPDGTPKTFGTQEVAHKEVGTQDVSVPDLLAGVCACGKSARPRGTQCWGCYKKARRSK